MKNFAYDSNQKFDMPLESSENESSPKIDISNKKFIQIIDKDGKMFWLNMKDIKVYV
jgi:hypothetical protein